MYKLVYYLKGSDGLLYNPTIVSGFACSPRGVCESKKKEISRTTHKLGVLKIEKV